MKIRFETTIDDIIAFNRFHCENSPMWRRLRLVLSVVLPAIVGLSLLPCGVYPGLYIFGSAMVISLAFIGCVILLSWNFFARWMMSSTLVSAVRKLLAEGSNHSILGWREMEVVDNRLIVNLELIHSSYDLRAIEKIIGNEKYTFVYISAIQAFVIPMCLYPEDDYREFMEELREAWDNRDAPRPARPQPDERVIASE